MQSTPIGFLTIMILGALALFFGGLLSVICVVCMTLIALLMIWAGAK